MRAAFSLPCAGYNFGQLFRRSPDHIRHDDCDRRRVAKSIGAFVGAARAASLLLALGTPYPDKTRRARISLT